MNGHIDAKLRRSSTIFTLFCLSFLLAPGWVSAQPSPPELVAPTNGTVVAGESLLFRWYSSDADEFYMEMATDSDFIDLVFANFVGVYEGNSIWQQIISGFPDNGFVYYWRIYAYDPYSGYSYPSTTWVFKNGPSGPPTAPGLTSPSNGAVVAGERVSFDWTLGERASDFYLRISSNPDLSDPIFSQWIGYYLGIDLVGFPDNGTRYYWQVVAYNELDYAYSPIYYFTNGPSAPPGTPQPIEPAQDQNVPSEVVSFRWQTAPRAADYHLQVSLDQTFTALVFDQYIGDYVGIDLGPFPDDGTQFFWRVRASNPLDDSPFCGIQRFVNGPSDVPEAPVLTSPSYYENVPGTQITFQWETAARAVDYELVVALDSGFAEPVYQEWVGDYVGVVLGGFPDNGTEYWWSVRARNSLGPGEASLPSVLVNGPSDVPGIAVGYSPANGSQVDGTEVLLQWDPAPRAAEYYVEVATDGGFDDLVFAEWIGYYVGLRLGGLPDNGVTLWWRVMAYNSLGEGPFSAAYYFKNGPSAVPSTPVLLSPPDGSEAGGEVVQLLWEPAERANDYKLEVSYTADFSIGVVFSGWVGNLIGGDFGGLLDNGDRFYWRVQARNELGTSTFSQVWSFVNGPSAPPDEPLLINPQHNSVLASSAVLFQWMHAARAASYALHVRSELGTVFSANVGHTDTHVLSHDAMNGTEFYWRVEATNRKGSTSSEEWFFVFNDCNVPEVGSGTGILGPQPHIDTCFDAGRELYVLTDISRRETFGGGMLPDAGIETQIFGAGLVESDDNHAWGAYSAHRPPVDAHVYAGRTYDYVFATFGLKSFDRVGNSMITLTDHSCQGITDNAFWNGYTVNFCPSGVVPSFAGALDVVAHEWGHAHTDKAPTGRVGNLVYAGESGAISEAFSDWLGTTVEHYFGEVNWTIGEMEGYDSVTRDLQTPPVYGHPDTYGGAYWVDVVGCTPASNNDFCGVHINCGVGNKMFYLLSEGGEHNGYVVEPIGIMKAMQIAFRANMVEWETDVTYEKAHEGMRNAAEYLFGGVGSPEYAAVNTAWNAVGVYAP
jgi:hypothetical protein